MAAITICSDFGAQNNKVSQFPLFPRLFAMKWWNWLPCLFNFYAEYIMRNAGLEEAQAGIKIDGRNINNLSMQMTPPLWQKVKKN